MESYINPNNLNYCYYYICLHVIMSESENDHSSDGDCFLESSDSEPERCDSDPDGMYGNEPEYTEAVLSVLTSLGSFEHRTDDDGR